MEYKNIVNQHIIDPSIHNMEYNRFLNCSQINWSIHTVVNKPTLGIPLEALDDTELGIRESWKV